MALVPASSPTYWLPGCVLSLPSGCWLLCDVVGPFPVQEVIISANSNCGQFGCGSGTSPCMTLIVFRVTDTWIIQQPAQPRARQLRCGGIKVAPHKHRLLAHIAHHCIGTSMATPIAAGNAILVREYFMRGYYPTGVPVRSSPL